MKITSILPLAAAASTVSAKSLLAVFPDEITVGETYLVEWLSDNKENLELKLVHKTSFGWEPTATLFEKVETKIPGGNFSWTVPKSTPTGEGYGLWLSSTNIPDNGSGYADLTKWFDVVAPKEKEDLKKM